MPEAHPSLAPPPRQLKRPRETIQHPAAWTYSLAEGALPAPAQQRLERAIRATGSRLERKDPGDSLIRIEIDDADRKLGPEGYRLSMRPPQATGSTHTVLLVASQAAGLSYGLTTLAQLIAESAFGSDHSTQAPARPQVLDAVEIVDRPAIANRGVMLDISRNRVPKQADLLELIEHLASLKINHLQLYIEHTFAYRGHEAVWKHDSPLTAEQVQELDAFCRERHIELAPNQNSFGHFHRWLVHDRYRPLAEVPEGVEHPFGPEPEPFSLCATDPAVFDLLTDLYDQLLPNFSSETFNVGLDETLDLGMGRSAAACALRGKHTVYLDYLNKVHRLVADRDHRMQFWGDIVLEQPELVQRLPKDATALVWGYERNHPFNDQCKQFAQADVDFWVCPGTSSWLSFAGRAHNALGNLSRAADAANRNGASGILITDWGDWGHMQPPFASQLGFLAGAAHAWNPTACDRWSEGDWQQALDRHVYQDPSGELSRANLGLGNAYRETETPNVNASVLFSAFRFLGDDLSSPRYNRLTSRSIERTVGIVQDAVSSVRDHRSERTDAALIVQEMEWVAQQLELGCGVLKARLSAGTNAGLESAPLAERRRLAQQLDHQWLRFEPLWHERSRPGGLRRTRGLFERWSRQLRVETPI